MEIVVGEQWAVVADNALRLADEQPDRPAAAAGAVARSTNGLTLGYALMVLGQTSEAIAVYAENVGRCRAAGNILNGIFSANEIVKLRALQGRLHAARASVEHALAWVAEEGSGVRRKLLRISCLFSPLRSHARMLRRKR